MVMPELQMPTGRQAKQGVEPGRDGSALWGWAAAAVWLWLMVILTGAALLLSDWALPGGLRLSVSRAVFQATSAATLTGYPTVPAIAELRPAGQAVVVAVAYVSATLTLVLGAVLVRAWTGLAVRLFTVVAVAAVMPMAAVVVGAVAVPSSPWQGAVLGLGAVSHSGLQVSNLPSGDWRVVAVLLPLSAAGAVGAAVVLDVLLGLFRRGHRCTDLTRWTVTLSCLALYVLAALIWWATPVPGSAMESGAGAVVRAIVSASWLSGWGYNPEPGAALPRGLLVAGMAVMWLGAGVGAASGGVGWYVLVVWLRGVVAVLRGRGLTPVSCRCSAVAAVWVLGQAVLTVVTLVALLHTEPQLAFERVLLLSVGSVSLAGVTTDPVSVVGPGLMVMSLAMVAGRLWSWAGLWWMWRVSVENG